MKAVNKVLENRVLIVTVMCVVFMAASKAFAITQPAADSFAYDVYDIAINKILNGAIGFVAGALCMVAGAISAVQAKLFIAALGILGGACLLNAASMVKSLGMVF